MFSLPFCHLFCRFSAYGLATLAYVLGWRRRILAHNIRQILGGPLSPGKKSVIARVHRFSLLKNAAYDILSLGFNVKAAKTLLISKKSEKHLNALQSSPALFLTAHFHNWEFLGSALVAHHVPLQAIAKPLTHARSQSWLMRQRKKLQLPTFPPPNPDPTKGSLFRLALTHLKKGGVVGLLWDQRPSRTNSQGTFFGLPVQLDPLPEFLIKHQPIPVYFGALLPTGEIRLLPLIKSGQSFQLLESRYHRCLEGLIAAYPQYAYTFFHRRFKNVALPHT